MPQGSVATVNSFHREFARRERWEGPDHEYWAAFNQYLNEPVELTTGHQAIVVLSHEDRDAAGNYAGMTMENEARVWEASRRLRNLPGLDKPPCLVIASSSEAEQDMLGVALRAGIPMTRIITMSEKPLRECHTAQQLQELAIKALEKGWTSLYVLSSFYHMVRCERTAAKYFTGDAANVLRDFGYTFWPSEGALTNPAVMGAQISLIEGEIERIKKYCT